MVRLTADVIEYAPQYFNPLHEREIDLRDNRIAMLENLGATEDQFDSIDVSHNELRAIDNLPKLRRLTTILASHNKVTRIAQNIAVQLPSLESLVLIENQIASVDALRPLRFAKHLWRLALSGNPLMLSADGRLQVIALLPQLRVLDFQRVKDAERAEAAERFPALVAASQETEADAKSAEATAAGSKRKADGEAAVVKRSKLTDEQKEQLAIKIASATSLEEMQRLEQALNDGVMPE